MVKRLFVVKILAFLVKIFCFLVKIFAFLVKIFARNGGCEDVWGKNDSLRIRKTSALFTGRFKRPAERLNAATGEINCAFQLALRIWRAA